MARLAGNAKLDSGVAATGVLVRDWSTHAHVARITPDEEGDWSIELPAGLYDTTTLGPVGYQPVCDGPIEVRA